MNYHGNAICWLFTVILFLVTVHHRTLSSKIATSEQATGNTSVVSKAVRDRWFQHWSIAKGRSVVTGGYAAKPGAFKFSAIIQTEDCCSAALISSKWLLTSTHCFSEEIGKGWAAAGGISYRSESDIKASNVQWRHLLKLLLYTESHSEQDLRQHDIMLAAAESIFHFNEFVQPIRFTDQRRFYTAHQLTCIVVGYGDKKYETVTMVKLMENCRPDGAITDNFVCVDEDRWPCEGDAGAPLVCRNMLIGVMRSYGLLDNDKCGGKPNELPDQNFTFVGYYRDWIVEHAPVKFGVWRSGSPGWVASGVPAAARVATLLLDAWMYLSFK